MIQNSYQRRSFFHSLNPIKSFNLIYSQKFKLIVMFIMWFDRILHYLDVLENFEDLELNSIQELIITKVRNKEKLKCKKDNTIDTKLIFDLINCELDFFYLGILIHTRGEQNPLDSLYEKVEFFEKKIYFSFRFQNIFKSWT